MAPQNGGWETGMGGEGEIFGFSRGKKFWGCWGGAKVVFFSLKNFLFPPTGVRGKPGKRTRGTPRRVFRKFFPFVPPFRRLRGFGEKGPVFFFPKKKIPQKKGQIGAQKGGCKGEASPQNRGFFFFNLPRTPRPPRAKGGGRGSPQGGPGEPESFRDIPPGFFPFPFGPQTPRRGNCKSVFGSGDPPGKPGFFFFFFFRFSFFPGPPPKKNLFKTGGGPLVFQQRGKPNRERGFSGVSLLDLFRIFGPGFFFFFFFSSLKGGGKGFGFEKAPKLSTGKNLVGI